MVKRSILLELKKVIGQRGEITKEQRDYARVELELIEEMYTMTNPADEKRPANCRTLESYISTQTIYN